MATLLKIIGAGVVGVMLGLIVTIASLDPDSRGTRVGPWRAALRDGTPDVDPYSLATVARSGLLPLGAAEGISFIAARDSAGGSLSPACDYVVAGPTPAARYWTLSLATPEGFPVANAANRYGFTSAEILRRDGEPATVTVSAQARAGNWLPLGKAGAFVLVLRLYDTSLNTAATQLTTVTMPSITKRECR